MREIDDLLYYSIEYAKELKRWQKIEGKRKILCLEWKIRYQNSGKFQRWLMRITTPKSLFKETKFLLN